MTKEELKRLVSYDPETGFLTRINDGAHRTNNMLPAGSKGAKAYIQIRLNGKIYSVHRLAWLISGCDLLAGYVIDHIDGNKLNNKLINLRAVTRSINCQNQRKPMSNGTSGFLGVSRRGDRWIAKIMIEGTLRYIGIFAQPEIAYQAYLAAKRQHHEGCTI